MKKAFTLVELLVVIAIIGILAAILIGSFSGGTESARAAKCLTNMRNLAAACQSYGMANDHYPPAGSLELFAMDESRGIRNVREVYSELPGWVSWASEGRYAGKPTSSIASSGWNRSMYDTDDEVRKYCITNGALWKYVSGNHDVYCCPSHVQKKKRLNPNWSYVMNGYFYWTARPGKDLFDSANRGVWYGHLERADRYLLFAEIPFVEARIGGVEPPETTASGVACDCVLQYKGLANSSANETIGFNHKTGKLTVANVVFADGHAEKLVYPKGGLSQGELQNLTQWLCTGVDVSFNGKRYEKLTN